MEVARTPETSVDIQLITRQYIPEDYELQPKYCWGSVINYATATYVHFLLN
jgi:hypothetical protein